MGGKHITYRATPIKISVDFSAETLQAKRGWDDIFKVLKENKTANQEIWQSCPSEMKREMKNKS